jgi:FRG domain
MGSSLPVERREYRTWAELKDRLRDMDGWLFRGHRQLDWDLSTSLERVDPNPVTRTESEFMLLQQFMAAAANYLQGRVPDNADVLGWLALMQHHGAPTRLLDWTRSPYVAAYFAAEEVAGDGACAIWAILRSWCDNRGRERLEQHGLPFDEGYRTSDVWAHAATGRRPMLPFDGVVYAVPALNRAFIDRRDD